MKRHAVITLAAAALLAQAVGASAAGAAAPSAAIVRALADPDCAADAPADARRKPAALLAFAGVKPGDRVGELIPGSGYFTRLFSKVVGPTGRVYVIWPKPYWDEAHPDPENLVALARTPAWRNIQSLVQPARAFSAPQPLDLVFISQNYHDYPDPFMGPADPNLFDRQVFAALRPGGVFLVVDHVAEAGSGLRDTNTLHRIDPAVVKAQVTAAGFIYVGAIDALRNPADDHRLKVFDPRIRGHTDQFVFKFKRPG